MAGAVSACPLTNDFTVFCSPYPVEGLAAWRDALGKSGRRCAGCWPTRRFASACVTRSPARRSFGCSAGEWQKVRIVEVADPRNAALEQRNLAELAAERQCDPLDLMLDLALSENLDTVFSAVLPIRTRRRWAGCSSTRPAWCRCPTPVPT
ncbi:MAG: hypothetical protein R3E68_22500 [Burkholderiaceae bacterium]